MHSTGQDGRSFSKKLRSRAAKLLVALLPPLRKFVASAEEARRRASSLETQVSSLEDVNALLRARVSSLEDKSTASAIPQQLWTPRYNRHSAPFSPLTLSDDQRALVERFQKFMYDVVDQDASRSYFVSWLGYEMLKWPTDLWVYQEIIAETKPDVIIETGTFRGGSALFYATLCDLLGHGQVVTVDIDESVRAVLPPHPRISYLTGSSSDPAILKKIEAIVANRANVLVILDSDHIRDHVLNELRLYCRFIPRDGHLIVEDTIINGHPAYPEFGPGPMEAVESFLAENRDFYVDRERERFY